MLKSILLLILTTISLQANAQIEKIGIFGGPAKVMNYHGTNQFISTGYRIGGMASFRLPGRFSLETGGFFDFHKMPEGEERYITTVDNLHHTLMSKREVNFGVPLGIMMRTNITQGCVTYLKMSVNPIFTLYQSQRVRRAFSEDLSHQSHDLLRQSRSGVEYYSTDFDFGFGTFWHIKSAGLQLCVEPKFTIVQHRASTTSIEPREIEIVPARTTHMSRMSFEITIYKNLNL